MSNFKKAWQEVKKGAPRELGLFLFMLVLAVFTAIIVIPVILLMNLLPTWTGWLCGAIFSIWLLFGDTIGRAWSALRGKDE